MEEHNEMRAIVDIIVSKNRPRFIQSKMRICWPKPLFDETTVSAQNWWRGLWRGRGSSNRLYQGVSVECFEKSPVKHHLIHEFNVNVGTL